MDYIFDYTYFRNAALCRDIGDLFAVYDKKTGELLGYRAVTKMLINNKEVCGASFPCDAQDLTPEEMRRAKRLDRTICG
jgi:hypothetical protein